MQDPTTTLAPRPPSSFAVLIQIFATIAGARGVELLKKAFGL